MKKGTKYYTVGLRALPALAILFLGFVYADDQSEMRRKWEESFKSPINFWGEVVDQQGKPVVGANVELAAWDKPIWPDGGDSHTTYRCNSDSAGKFHLVQKQGSSLSVDVEAKGYAPAYHPDTSSNLSYNRFDYSSESEKMIALLPTKDKPHVFVLRKKGKIANLKELKRERSEIPKDGTEIGLTLKNTPITLSIRCWSSAPDTFSYDAYDWRAEVRVKGGKLQPINNPYAVMAPEEGYQDIININMPSDLGENWEWSSPREARELWVRLDDGTHARMEINVITGRKHSVMARGWLNMDKTHSFEK